MERRCVQVANPPQEKSSRVYETVYERIAETKTFKQIIEQKKKFIIPYTVFFLIFYFTLPILTSNTEILHQKAIGDITWVWIYGILQFIMTWTLVTIYMKKAHSFDQLVEQIVEEERQRR
jgi:uncharacterized membrane protein (DUF485 family)